MKKIQILLLSIAVMICFSSTVLASTGNTNISSAKKEYFDVPESAINFIDYYTDETDSITEFPDYYAGIRMTSDYDIVMYVTTDVDEIKDLVYEICESEQVQFEKVKYSFNTLNLIQDDIMQRYSEPLGIKYSKLDIECNQINLYVEDPSRDYTQIERDFSEYPSIFNIESAVLSVEGDRTSLGEIVAINRLALNSTTSGQIYTSGMRTYRRSTGTGSNYDETMGTVGFVAVNSAGERIVITHGHDIASRVCQILKRQC